MADRVDTADTRTRSFWNDLAEKDHYVAIYDNAETQNPDTRDEAFDEGGRTDAALLAGFVHSDMTVLDLGCGIGRVLRHVAPLCERAIGLDISETMLAKARQHLAGVENVDLVQTDGAALRDIDSDSIDFVYSLLCLIHVDKRSAYKYLREIARVLRKERLAHLQFHDILSRQGLEKFKQSLGVDYPLEFYSEQEVTLLLRDCGLDVLSCVADGEYLFVTAYSGDREQWRSSIGELGIDVARRSGFFLDPSSAGSLEGAIDFDLTWSGEHFLGMMPVLSVVDEEAGRQVLEVRAPLCFAPGQTVRGRFALSLEGGRMDGAIDLASAGRRTRSGEIGSARGSRFVVTAGMLPSGFDMTPETVGSFPELFLSCRAEVTAR